MTVVEPPPEDDRFDALWREHAGAVMRYARRRVLDSEVDEVVAETFLVAWRRLDDVPPFALPWLLGVARGVTANLRRGSRRREALHARLLANGAESRPGRRPGDDLDRIAIALAGLREADREVLSLVAWDGLTYEQAAEALGCSRRAFAVRLHRARRRLRSALTGLDPEPPAPSISDGAETPEVKSR